MSFQHCEKLAWMIFCVSTECAHPRIISNFPVEKMVKACQYLAKTNCFPQCNGSREGTSPCMQQQSLHFLFAGDKSIRLARSFKLLSLTAMRDHLLMAVFEHKTQPPAPSPPTTTQPSFTFQNHRNSWEEISRITFRSGSRSPKPNLHPLTESWIHT